MKIWLICGVLGPNTALYLQKRHTSLEAAAGAFQNKLIDGLRINGASFRVISVPFIGSYPTTSQVIRFKPLKEDSSGYTYIGFQNISILRNYFRRRNLKRYLKTVEIDDSEENLFLIYSAHTPFVSVASEWKKKHPSIKICLIVPDLPMYMNLNRHSCLYSTAKRIDTWILYRKLDAVDSYVLLTEQMTEKLPIGGKPYLLTEGILDNIDEPTEDLESDIRTIVYTGAIRARHNICELVDAFQAIKGDKFRLIMCGSGDAVDYVQQACVQDSRISWLGQLDRTAVLDLQKKATVLVNPRLDSGDFTRFSFPSKLLEYLSAGKPTVSAVLPGMPLVYKDFVYEIDGTLPPVTAIQKAIEAALNDSLTGRLTKQKRFADYAKDTLLKQIVVRNILKLNGLSASN